MNFKEGDEEERLRRFSSSFFVLGEGTREIGVKGGRKVGEARQCPPFPQATGMKGGQRVAERWEKPGNAHPSPRQWV